MDDAFLQIKEDIESSLRLALQFSDQYLVLCKQGTPKHSTQQSNAAQQFHPHPVEHLVSYQEKEWLSTELRNVLRSIEWDLEDLEQTDGLLRDALGAAKKIKKSVANDKLSDFSPRHGKKSLSIGHSGFESRRKFIDDIRHSLQEIRGKMSGFDARFKISSPVTSPRRKIEGESSSDVRDLSQYKYSKLENADDDVRYSMAGTDSAFDDVLLQQKLIMKSQDENLEKIGGSVHALKDMSQQINTELDEQSTIIDEITHETERTQSRMDAVVKKLAKVTHMSDDRRQWQVIGILIAALVLVIILFIIIP